MQTVHLHNIAHTLRPGVGEASSFCRRLNNQHRARFEQAALLRCLVTTRLSKTFIPLATLLKTVLLLLSCAFVMLAVLFLSFA